MVSARAEPTRAHLSDQSVESTSNTPIIVLSVLVGVMWIFVLLLAFLFWRWRRRLAHIESIISPSRDERLDLENGGGARSPRGLAEPDKFYIRNVTSGKTDTGNVTNKGDGCAFAGLSASTKQEMLACDKKTPVALNPLYSPTLLSFCDPSMLPPPPPTYSATIAVPPQSARFSVLARASRWSMARRRS